MRLLRQIRTVETPHGPMRLVVLRPAGQTGPLPGLLWIHGGGYATGFAEMARVSCGARAAARVGAVLVSPGYRRSVHAPFPAALLDCYSALLYLKHNAAALGIRDDQIFVGGESAGGGLCAALCMLAHDRGTVNIAMQLPLYPMLDCFDTPSSAHNHLDPTWGSWRNHAAWRCYLRSLRGRIPAYASASRREAYAGLPPCYTFVCRDEPFYCETRDYVAALKAAGVEAAMDVYPGNFHAFDMLLPWTARAREAHARFLAQFAHAVAHNFAPQIRR